MMIHSKKLFLLISIGILAFLVTNSFSSTRMPQFELPDAVNGERVSSSSFEGKTILLIFFATWCPPCLEEIPTLIDLQNEYADDNFTVIGLSVDQGGARAVKRLVEKKSINYPVFMADAQVMEDFGGVYGIPVSFLVNKKGNVVKKYTGYAPKSILEKDLENIL